MEQVFDYKKFDYEKFIKYFNENDGFTKRNNLRMLSLAPGKAVAEVEITRENCNFMGTVHGAILFGLVDITAGCAFGAYGTHCMTLSTNISFLRSASAGKLTAVAKELSRTKRIGVMEVEITDEENNLICKATVTMYVSQKAASLNGSMLKKLAKEPGANQ